jgi:hypothetical protein
VAAGRFLAGVVIAGLIAFGLAAVAFLPMALATGGMIRHLGATSHIIGHASIPWDSFNLHQLNPSSLSHLLFDSSDLGVLGGLYVGPLAVLGVLLCVIAYQRGDAFARFLLSIFGATALYFLLASFGTHFGLAYLHFYIPLVNRIREAGRYLAIFTILTALLCRSGLPGDHGCGKRQVRTEGWVAPLF